MTTDQQKIALKIQALIAKAQSTEHQAEAEAFMAKAQQLLEDHQLDLGDLVEAQDPVIINSTAFEQTDSSPSWYKDLFVALGRLYGCKAVKSPKLILTPTGKSRWGYAIELTGRESAIKTTELMFPWVKKQCQSKGTELSKQTGRANNMEARRVGNALVNRIWGMIRTEELKAKQAQEAQSANIDLTRADANALVTQDRVLQVFNERYKNLRIIAGRATSTSAAARAAASSIGLHRQAGGSATLRIGS